MKSPPPGPDVPLADAVLDVVSFPVRVYELLDPADLTSFVLRYANRASDGYLGIPFPSLIGRRLQEITPAAKPADLETLARILRSGLPTEAPLYTYPGSDGARTVYTTLHPIDARRIALVARDVTAQEQAHAALARAHAEIRDLYDNAPCGYHSIDATGTFLQVNDTELRWLGYSREELVGKKRFPELLTEESRAIFASAFPRFRRDGLIRGLAFELVRKDGSPLEVLLSATAVRDEAGQFVASRSTMVDVSGQRLTERQRGEAAALLDAVIQAIPQALVVRTADLRVERVNPAGEAFLESLSLATARPPDSMSDLAAPSPEALRRALEEGRIDVRRQQGGTVEAPRWFDVRRIPVGARGGPPTHVLVVAEDVTDSVVRERAQEQRRLNLVAEVSAKEAALARVSGVLAETERQLAHAQRLESLGRLAGGVAHDFNNMLSVILSYADMIAGSLEVGHPVLADLQEIQSAAQRAATLTGQLLAFGRQQVMRVESVDLSSVVGEVERMLKRLIGEDIELEVVKHGGPYVISADPSRIEQILANLAVNARDAMPQGGRLTVELGAVELDEAYAELHAEVVPGPYVLLAMTDTGSGMDAATRERIFEPFFTTKPRGRGTGLGLAMVFGTVKQSGGHIWVYSEVDQGTCFRLYFPASPEQRPSPTPVRAPAPRGAAKVLLVEDDASVRRAARSCLERSGYEVLEAQTAEDAVALAGLHGSTIGLLLTDVIMPKVSGVEVAKRVLAIVPGLPCLFMSGYTDEAIVRHGMLDEGAQFLQKPFTPQSLTMRVAEVLGDPTGRR